MSLATPIQRVGGGPYLLLLWVVLTGCGSLWLVFPLGRGSLRIIASTGML